MRKCVIDLMKRSRSAKDAEASLKKLKTNNKNDYVYLIREREHIRLKENTYKLGKTTQEPNSRLRGYPNNSEVIMYIEVENCHAVEKQLIDEFDARYDHMKEYGREYYHGDKRAMQRTFMRITCTANEAAAARKKSWFWWTWDKLFHRK